MVIKVEKEEGGRKYSAVLTEKQGGGGGNVAYNGEGIQKNTKEYKAHLNSNITIDPCLDV